MVSASVHNDNELSTVKMESSSSTGHAPDTDSEPWMGNEQLEEIIEDFQKLTVFNPSVPKEISMNSEEILELLLKDYKLEAFIAVSEGVCTEKLFNNCSEIAGIHS